MKKSHSLKKKLFIRRFNLYIIMFFTIFAFLNTIIVNIHSPKIVLKAIAMIVVILLMVFNFYIPRLRLLEMEIYEADDKEAQDEN